ncbi:hypothetical protein AeNC1_009346 [Aphanomyces euteiches]|nr:hypothetical protein AeNC1_009346 [Aphanomyces euteiches]
MPSESPPASRKPEDTPFKQQRVPSWQPIFSPMWVISAFFFIGIVFLPIGIGLYAESRKPIDYRVQYDGIDWVGSNQNSDNTKLTQLPGASCYLENKTYGHTFNLSQHGCVVSFTLDQDVKGPILVFYEIGNFSQNYKHYAKSRSSDQLRGKDNPDISNCQATFTDVDEAVKFNSSAAPSSYQLNPCGLMANTLFNDIFWMHSIVSPDGKNYNQTDLYDGVDVLNLMDQSDLSWNSDKNKFKNYANLDSSQMYLWENPKYGWIIPSRVGQQPIINRTAWTKPTTTYGVESDRFKIWMREAGLPYFRKLYGRINMDFPKGTTISFLISSNFPIADIHGRKSIAIATKTWLGGQNPGLAIGYIAIGGICLILSFLFFGKHKLSPRRLGDANYLVWQGKNG